MQIGLDFDGVTAFTERVKQHIAERILGIPVSLSDLFIPNVQNGTSSLTKAQSDKVVDEVRNNGDWYDMLEPVPGALDGINALLNAGHDLKIITGRDGKGLELAQEWCRHQGIAIPLVGVGYRKSKANAAEGYDVFVDDDLEYLMPLVGVVEHRYLFSWVYNEAQHEATIAARVHGWNGVLAAIAGLHE